jgi:hypothetical protein
VEIAPLNKAFERIVEELTRAAKPSLRLEQAHAA